MKTFTLLYKFVYDNFFIIILEHKSICLRLYWIFKCESKFILDKNYKVK